AIEYMPNLLQYDSTVYGWNRELKLPFVFVSVAASLVTLAPLMLAIAVAIKLTSRGPVLYRQERMGLDGRRFRMLKFRSMVADAEATTGPRWAVPDAPRRTRLGAALRRLSLDQLPQS